MGNPYPRILVVDDEQHQLDTICRGLNLYGYRCEGVLSVEAALESLTGENGERFDLLLTDLTMPGRSGLDLIERVQQQWSGLPIVVITGLAQTVEVDVVRGLGVPLLTKPFAPDTLDVTIRRVLERTRGAD